MGKWTDYRESYSAPHLSDFVPRLNAVPPDELGDVLQFLHTLEAELREKQAIEPEYTDAISPIREMTQEMAKRVDPIQYAAQLMDGVGGFDSFDPFNPENHPVSVPMKSLLGVLNTDVRNHYDAMFRDPLRALKHMRGPEFYSLGRLTQEYIASLDQYSDPVLANHIA